MPLDVDVALAAEVEAVQAVLRPRRCRVGAAAVGCPEVDAAVADDRTGRASCRAPSLPVR